MGLGRLKHHMANETYGEAAKHVWRLEFILPRPSPQAPGVGA